MGEPGWRELNYPEQMARLVPSRGSDSSSESVDWVAQPGRIATRSAIARTRRLLLSVMVPIYDFNEDLDTYVMRPVAEVYVDYTPELVRDGVTNFFSNLGYINVIFNELLQGKVKQGIADVGRFTINSTLGIGGFIEVASAGSVPKHDEDFGQSLGVWGVDEGAYLVLPVLGPRLGARCAEIHHEYPAEPLILHHQPHHRSERGARCRQRAL